MPTTPSADQAKLEELLAQAQAEKQQALDTIEQAQELIRQERQTIQQALARANVAVGKVQAYQGLLDALNESGNHRETEVILLTHTDIHTDVREKSGANTGHG